MHDVPALLAQWAGPLHALEDTDALRATRINDKRVLILAGGVGTGKSVAAASWAVARSGAWIYSRALVTPADWGDEWRDLLERSSLVIDDVGTEGESELKRGWSQRFDELIDARIANGRNTLITTNAADRKAFASIVGARVVDRLREHGKWVDCGGKSLRAFTAPRKVEPVADLKDEEQPITCERMCDVVRGAMSSGVLSEGAYKSILLPVLRGAGVEP